MTRRWPFAAALAAAMAAAAVVVAVPPPGPAPLGTAQEVRDGLHDSYMGELKDAAGAAQATITLTITGIRRVAVGSAEAAPFRRAAPGLGAGLYFTGEHALSGDNFPRPLRHAVIGFVDPASGRAVIIPVALAEATGDDYPGAFVGTLARDMDRMDFGWVEPDGTPAGSLVLDGLE